MTALFAALAGVVLLVWRARATSAIDARGQTLAQLAVTVTVLYFLIGSYWFQPWYVTWAVTLAAFVPTSTRAVRVSAAYGASALCAALLADYARHTTPPLLAGWQLSALIVAALWLAVALALYSPHSSRRLTAFCARAHRD